MAKSKFEYVRAFEGPDDLFPQSWIIISLAEVKLSTNLSHWRNNYINMLRHSSQEVMHMFKDIKFAYISNDCVHFVLNKDTTLYKRRHYKLLTYLTSAVTGFFTNNLCKQSGILEVPCFVGTLYLLISDQLLRDYFTHYQHKHHISNLRNTLLLASYDAGLPIEKSKVDSMTESDINENLFSHFGKNYTNEPTILKRGLVLARVKSLKIIESSDIKNKSKSNSSVIEMDSIEFKNDYLWESVLYLSTQFNKKSVINNLFKNFEIKKPLMFHSWHIVRLDGKAFHEFSQIHGFTKPNDVRALHLMNIAACDVMKEYSNIKLSYGESDEYSFVFDRYKMIGKECIDGNILSSKCVSIFTASYVANWHKIFGNDSSNDCPIAKYYPDVEFSVENIEETSLQKVPAFDGRIVSYPTNSNLR